MCCIRLPQLTLSLAALVALLAASVADAAEDLLPRPVSLQPAIAFWTRVYTEVDSVAGYVHDSRNPGIVYETLHFNWYDSPQIQEKIIDQATRRYQSALLALATGKRADLGDDEQKVLALWGENATSKSLLASAENVRFQRGQADRFRDGIIRAGAWENHIQETLTRLGLPTALAALPHVESSYHPLVRSQAGAAGLWQFTRFTGEHYLRVDHVVDERLDPLKSTAAAARLLQKNYSVTKSWPMAITAYNHGLSGVRRAVRQTGSRDIGDIVREYSGPRFGFASRNYYAAFLAAVDVASNSEQYFGTFKRHSPDGYQLVEVPAYLPASELAQQLEVDADVLKMLNPALQSPVWDGSKYVPKGYLLRLPVATGNGNASALLKHIAIAEGHEKQVPDLFYKVRRGDTLSGIALRYNISVRDLMDLNALRSKHRIRAGQSLMLPGASAPEAASFASLESGVSNSESVPDAQATVPGNQTARPGDPFRVMAAPDYALPDWLWHPHYLDVDVRSVLPLQGSAIMNSLVNKTDREATVQGAEATLGVDSCTVVYPVIRTSIDLYYKGMQDDTRMWTPVNLEKIALGDADRSPVTP